MAKTSGSTINTVFEKVLQAQKDLPNGWRFRLYEGFRSVAVQQMLFDNMYTLTKQRFPNLSGEALFHETTRLVSPVTNFDGSKNIPAHNSGGAVDIEIIRADGTLVEMGMTAKEWCVVEPDLCRTDCTSISVAATKNREILLDVMTAHGFINYPTEWWHYSYGDRYWAYHADAPHAIYGSADDL